MAQTPAKILTHVADALDRQLGQFRSKANITAFLRALVAPVQPLEDAYYQLLVERGIDTAIGAQLDVIGRVVGIAREGLDDTTFRNLIRTQIRANTSGGTIENILAVFTQLDVTNSYTLTSYFPAGFLLAASQAFDLIISPARVGELLRRSRAGGVRAQLLYPSEQNSFRFSASAALVPSDDEGFAVEWPIVAGSAGSWNNLAADAAHLFAVDMATAAFIRSADQGLTWPTSGNMFGGATVVKAFKQRNNEFLAVADSGAVWSDGPTAFAPTSGALPADVHRDFEWLPSNGRYFTVSNAGNVYYKTLLGDASPWTLEVTPAAPNNLHVAHVANGFALAGGGAGTIIRSATASSFAIVASFGGGAFRYMVSSGPIVVATSVTWPSIAYSVDSGATWTQVSAPLTGNILGAVESNGTFYFLTSVGADFYVEIVQPGALDFGVNRVRLTGAPGTTLWPLDDGAYVASANRFAHFRDDGPFDPATPKFPWLLAPATALQNAAIQQGLFHVIATSIGILRVPSAQDADYGGHLATVIEA